MQRRLLSFLSNRRFHLVLLYFLSFVTLLAVTLELQDCNRMIKDNYCRTLLAKMWWQDGLLNPPQSVWLPLHYFVIRLFYPISGGNFIWAGELASLFAGALTIPTLYLLAQKYLSRSFSLGVALIALTSWPFLEFSTMAMAEPLYLLLCLITLLFLSRQRLAGAGVALGLATLTRVEAWVLLAATNSMMLLQILRKKMSLKSFLVFLATSGVLFSLNFLHFRGHILEPISSHNQGHAAIKRILGMIDWDFANFSLVIEGFGWPWVLWSCIGFPAYFFLRKHKRKPTDSFVLGVIAIALLKFFGIYEGNIHPEPRYLLLFFFVGLLFATVGFQRWLPKPALAVALLTVGVFSSANTYHQISQERAKISNDMLNASHFLNMRTNQDQSIAFAVTDYDHCWFKIQAKQNTGKLVTWYNERHRLRKGVKYEDVDDFVRLNQERKVDFVLIEKGMIYQKLLNQYLAAFPEQDRPFQLKLEYDNPKYLVFSVLH